MAETMFVGLYRGRSVGDARLVAVSSDREIVAKFFRELAGESEEEFVREDGHKTPALAMVRGDERD